MNSQDYEAKKRECWEEYCQTHPLCTTHVMRLNFDWTFDRAYALGKQEKDADGEPNPAEPKFKYKIGDKVRIINNITNENKHNGDITEVVYVDESDLNVPYKVDIYDEELGGGLWYRESDLETYTEPKSSTCTETFTDDCQSQRQSQPVTDCNHFVKDSDMVEDDIFNDIVNRGCRNDKRLTIAAQMAVPYIKLVGTTHNASSIAKVALELADALIARTEKGVNDE